MYMKKGWFDSSTRLSCSRSIAFTTLVYMNVCVDPLRLFLT